MAKEKKKIRQTIKGIFTPNKKTNYQLVSVIVSIAAIIVSCVLGVFSLIKEGGFQRPILRYSVHQARYGQLIFEVKNTGNIPANNVIINMIINPIYDAKDCTASSPFHENLPIQNPPDLENTKQYELPTTTWKISSIPQGASFYFDCEIYYTQTSVHKIPEGQSGEVDAELMEFLLSQETIPIPTPIGEVCYTVRKTYISSVSEWDLKEVTVSNVLLSFEVFSENSKPAKEISNISNVSIWEPKESSYVDYEVEFCVIDEK